MLRWEYCWINSYGGQILSKDNQNLPDHVYGLLFHREGQAERQLTYYDTAYRQMGDAGWELSSELRDTDGVGVISTFKRPKKENLFHTLKGTLDTFDGRPSLINFLDDLLLSHHLTSEERSVLVGMLVEEHRPNFGESFNRAKGGVISSGSSGDGIG